MRPLLYSFIITIFAFCSCNPHNPKMSQQDNKVSIVGKWHRFSLSNGYSEFDIDSQFVVFYNQKVGRIKYGYKIENDTFKYIGHNYSAKFLNYGDSIFLEGNDGTTATLLRFREPDIPFESIPEEIDSALFDSYIKGFDKRMIEEFKKIGIEFLDGPNEEEDTSKTYQQLLNNKMQ